MRGRYWSIWIRRLETEGQPRGGRPLSEARKQKEGKMEQLSLFDSQEAYNPPGQAGCGPRIWMNLWARSIFWERERFCASSLSRTGFPL